ncbi:hypothetical protein [Streptomyces xiamenensis]|uniref:hypothetical protein n=1 Tax=Streptomyces xiamenensis TaxID=408015 RepID=UPI0035DDFD93
MLTHTFHVDCQTVLHIDEADQEKRLDDLDELWRETFHLGNFRADNTFDHGIHLAEGVTLMDVDLWTYDTENVQLRRQDGAHFEFDVKSMATVNIKARDEKSALAMLVELKRTSIDMRYELYSGHLFTNVSWQEKDAEAAEFYMVHPAEAPQ